MLIDFLNQLLPPEHQIHELFYKKSEQLGSHELDRKAIFDLYCESQHGHKFIVELQKAKQNFFKDRSVFYATFPIREQAERGEWNYQYSGLLRCLTRFCVR
ncbi:MAG: PD-(D/E)XK nuclease family transposase [Thiotrichaceae bacterium]